MKVNELKRGQVIEYDGQKWIIIGIEHVTPGNWRAIYHFKLKNLNTGSVITQRMNPNDDVPVLYIERRELEYLYKDGEHHVFMDTENYEQSMLDNDLLEDVLPYIPHNARVTVMFAEGKPVTVELPAAVELKITETEPAVRGDTATNVTKRATVETGLVIKVPSHIKEGEIVKVDTRTGEFIGRASTKK